MGRGSGTRLLIAVMVLVLAGLLAPGAARAEHDVGPTQVYFPQTGHTLRNDFLIHWRHLGGLEIFGYPITEEFLEVNPEDGKTYTVQYFERARFEHHPEFAGTEYEVLLGLLGNEMLRERGWIP